MAATFQHDPTMRLKRLGLGLHGLGLSIVLATAGLGYLLAIRPLENRLEEVAEQDLISNRVSATPPRSAVNTNVCSARRPPPRPPWRASRSGSPTSP